MKGFHSGPFAHKTNIQKSRRKCTMTIFSFCYYKGYFFRKHRTRLKINQASGFHGSVQYFSPRFSVFLPANILPFTIRSWFESPYKPEKSKAMFFLHCFWTGSGDFLLKPGHQQFLFIINYTCRIFHEQQSVHQIPFGHEGLRRQGICQSKITGIPG